MYFLPLLGRLTQGNWTDDFCETTPKRIQPDRVICNTKFLEHDVAKQHFHCQQKNCLCWFSVLSSFLLVQDVSCEYFSRFFLLN